MKAAFGVKAAVASLVAAGVLIALLNLNPRMERTVHKGGDGLMLYCAAGMKRPVDAAIKEYGDDYDIDVQVQYAGSGTLLSNIKIAKRGDLYLAADDSYIALARESGVVAEAVPLATMRPVVALRKGNPKRIKGVADLLREDVSFAIANPDAAAIGKITRDALAAAGLWERIRDKCKVSKPTVMDVATDVAIGSVDAGIIWDATAQQYKELEHVTDPLLETYQRRIEIGLLTRTKSPTAALHFARYLGAPEKGLRHFAENHFKPVDGDIWEETPEIVLFSGGVNRLAIEDTLRAFEEREGVLVTRVYNGCGILVSQIYAGEVPDAYFACDTSFMTQVGDLFPDSQRVSGTDMVMLVGRGNPKEIETIADLARSGMRIGVANADQSALGALTKRMLSRANLYESIMKNVKVQTPTADLLVNQLRTGALDAVIVYEANTALVRNQLEIVKIKLPGVQAFQPIAVSKTSPRKHTARRLVDAILSAASRESFESFGFSWEAQAP